MSGTRSVNDLRLHPRADVVPFPEPDQHDELVADIERRGVVVPLDILADGTVVDGRTRLTIARLLGLAEVPVRIVAPDDPFDYMVRAALLRRDLTKSQRAMLALQLPEYQKAKAEAAERQSPGRPARNADTNVRDNAAHTRATDAIAPVAGVSGSYIRKAEAVAERAPELVPLVMSGEMTVAQARSMTAPTPAKEEKEEQPTKFDRIGRLPIPKRTRPARPWSRHFTVWCRAALPEDRPVLLDMAREIDQALSRIGATK